MSTATNIPRPADFRRFIESPRPHGCETPIGIVRKIVAGTDVEYRFEELIRGEPGAVAGDVRNPYGVKGKPDTEITCDIITGNLAETIPFPTASPPPPTGTSTSYALRRLKREGKDDLLGRVYAGEITPNRAMIDARTAERMKELRLAVTKLLPPLGKVGAPEDNDNAAKEEGEENKGSNATIVFPDDSRDSRYAIRRLRRDASEVNDDPEDRARKAEGGAR